MIEYIHFTFGRRVLNIGRLEGRIVYNGYLSKITQYSLGEDNSKIVAMWKLKSWK